MSRMRSNVLALAAGTLALGVVASCDSPTKLPSTGSIAPRIELIRRDTTGGRASAVLPPTSMRARAIGPTADDVDLVLQGGFWRGVLENLSPGPYEVIIEGIANGQVQYYGRATGVTVVRGQTASPPIPFGEAVPAVNAPTLTNTTSFSQRLVFNSVPGASGYTVEYTQDQNFDTGVTSFVSADTTPLIAVTQPGTWYMRTRAILPNVLATTVPWSDPRSWVVLEAENGDNESDAQPVAVTPTDPETVVDRNLTPTKRSDWHEFDVRAGDSLFVETFAARLTNASPLNTVLELFKQDGSTSLATNDNITGSTDSRIVLVVPETERVMVEVTGAGNTSGHYELNVEIRRLPAAPTSLTAVVASGTSATIDWTDNADNETGFDVERCLGAACTDFAVVGTTLPNVSIYTDAALTQGSEYRWRVRARNAVGTSVYTDIAAAAMVGPLAPTALVATTFNNTRIDLSWTDNATNETGYQVERCLGAACDTFVAIGGTLPAGTVAYSDLTAAFNSTYRYQVRAINNVVPSDYSNIASANTIPPATPTALVATVMGPTRIDLAWTDNASNEIGFRIERCTGDACSNFAEIGTVLANVVTYQDNSVATNTGYRYRVRAYHAVTGVDYTNLANADTRPPTAPTLLTATTTSATSINLVWQDNSDDELNFSIQRCSSGPTCTDFTQIATTLADAEAFTDNSATVGNSYRYQVVAIGVPGNSAPTNVASANTLLPAAPTALTATTIDAGNIELNWTDNANNETAWEISRCTGAACPTPTPLDTIPSGTTTYTDASVTPGVSYVYAVRAMNISGRSAPSNNAGANTLPPSAPTGFTATTITGTQVDLAWTNTDASITGTRVERCTGEPCGAFTEIAFVPQPASAYSDVSATLGNIYKYRLRAQNAADVSGYTAEASVSTELPAAATALTATTVSATQIDLAWVVSTGPGVVGHLVERCAGPACNSGYVVIDSLGAAAAAYQNSAVAAEGDYGYRITAVNVVGRGAPSNAVNANTRTPAAPTGLSATVMPGIVRLAWTDNADNELGVVIERCDGGGCSPVDLATRPMVGLVTWDDSSVVASTEYTYRVRAYNNANNSPSSNDAFANTLIAAQVTVLSATAVSTTEIDLSWTPSASQGTGLITGYNVYRCDGVCDPATGTLLATLGAAAVLYSDGSVSADSEYTYMVVPFTAFGETPRAGSATAFASTALPAAPSGLVGTLLSPTSIQLDWTDNSDDETQFELAQCSGAGCTGFTTVATLGAGVETFLADTLTFSVEYRFLVRAVNTAGASAWSDTVSIGTTVPAVPTDMRAFITDGSGNIRLMWTDASDDETLFDFEFCSGGGCETWNALGLQAAANSTQIDIGSGGANTYRFRVRAVNAAGSSAPSAFTQITGDAPYAAPTGTLATTTGPTSILITWSDQTDNETVFRILRCTGGGCDPLAGAEVGTVPRDSTSFLDTSVPSGGEFRYAVVAANGFAEAPSAAFDGHTMLPDAPGVLSATTLSNTEIALQWSDGGPFETGYVIERCQGGSCNGFAPIDTVPANFVSYNDTGLSPNVTYRYQVRAINAVGASAYSNIAEKATDIPATPSGLSALAITATRIDLAWTDNATNEEFYIVERCGGLCDESGSFVEIETGLAPGAQAFADNTVSAGQTYSYRVRALNAGGVSPATNIASAVTAAPIDPTNLAVATLSGTLIQLTWTDNATNELTYRVERCASATCPTFAQVRTLPANTTAYVDTVAVDDEYTYRVRAVNNVGPSGYTLEETANTIRPVAASDFTVTTVSGTRIDLTWTDNATNEDGYVLERCSGDGCGTFVLLDSLPPDANGYQNDGIATQTSFTYRLYAYNIAGESPVSGPLTATTITPAAPTGLSSVLAAPGQIDLTWTDNANNELQYRIERCAGSGTCSTPELMTLNAVEVATLPPDANSYSDAGLAPSTLYFYRVRATNTAGTSAYSAIVSRSTSVPPAPTGLSSFTELATRVDLFWADASANEEGFRVERCVGADPCTVFTQIAQLPANTQTYIDNAAPPAEPFLYYRVIAFNGGGGNASNVSFASTVVPAAPSALAATVFTLEAVTLGWTDNASDEAGFYVERCVGLDCLDFTRLDTLAANAVTFEDTSATPGNVYRYRVQAFGNGRSDYAAIAEAATIVPNAPTDLVATAVSDTRVNLTWTDNTATGLLWNEAEFLIYRCAGVSCTPVALHASVGRDTTFFVDSLLTPGETYSYQVVADILAAASAPSNVATAATTVPAIPTALADSTVSATEVLLSWVDNAVNETGYEIERCEGSSCTNFAPVDTAPADAQSRVVGGLVGTTVYRFQIRAFNANGSSGYSNAVVAQSDVPPAPTALAGVNVSASQVNLSWVDNAENETAYIVERCDETSCTFAVIDSLPPNTTSYQDASISIDTLYQYRVRASNFVGASPYTGTVAVSTYRPETPTGLAATPISATRVDLTWTDVAVNDTVIVVQRCLGFECNSFVDIDSLPPDATSYSDLTVTVNNTYNYRLRAENAAGASAPTDSVEVGTFIPSDPSGLTATVNSASQITLDWVDNSNTENDFLIERCDGSPCGPFTQLVVVAADVQTFQDLTVSLGNTYEYRVIARAGGGNSGPSNVATVNTFPAGDVTVLTSSPQSATTAQLTWTPADNLSGYQIATVSGIDTTFFAAVSAGVTDTLVAVTTGLNYNFVVRAINAAAPGAYAGTFVSMTPPPAPDLSAFPLTASQVTLSWTDTTGRETGFELERGFFNAGSFGAYTTVSTHGPDVTADVDDVPAPNGRYRYRVRAVNSVGAGAYSNVVDLTLTGPVSPSGLLATVTAPGQITLTWTDNSDSEQSFSIERSVGNNFSYAQVATVAAGTQVHVDSLGLAINTAYYYRVRAVNNIGASGYSNEALTSTTVPNPVGAFITTILSSTSIRLDWDAAPAVGELGFRVYRCTGPGCLDFTLVDGAVPADATTYTDVSATYGTFYRYQVRPYNIAGEAASHPTAQRVLVLPTPTSVTALPIDRTSVRVKWNAAVFTWETGFEIEQCEGIDCLGFTPLATLAADDSMTISTGLPPDGVWHRYRVRAVADGNLGPWSSIMNTHTPKEVTLGDTLVTVTNAELIWGNMTHYVVSMPAGSPTVEFTIANDPGGTTTNQGTFLLVSRGKGIERPANQIYNVGTSSDTLCAPGIFTPSTQPSVTCSLPNPGVTTDYFITTYSNPYTNLFLSVLPGPTTYSFNNCGQTGRLGPNQGLCDAIYSGTSLQSQVAVVDGGFQNWTVPFTGRWAVTAVGAAGASATPGFNGGRGAQIYGEFVLTSGQNLRMAVGQLGSGVGTFGNGGGGGGSFVFDVNGGSPMVIAGGGGGTRGAAAQNGCDASTTAFGIVGSGSSSTSPCTVKASDAGQGGIVSSGSWGSAGAGFNSNGASDSPYGSGGNSWANFLLGGDDTFGCGTGFGGFGGGGSGGGCNGGGGGGGYSGGDGGWIAGGGGSFNAGTNTAAVAGVGTGHGFIILKYLGPVTP